MDWKYLLLIIPLFIVVELYVTTQLFSMVSQPSDTKVTLGVIGLGLNVFAIIKLYIFIKKKIKF